MKNFIKLMKVVIIMHQQYGRRVSNLRLNLVLTKKGYYTWNEVITSTVWEGAPSKKRTKMSAYQICAEFNETNDDCKNNYIDSMGWELGFFDPNQLKPASTRRERPKIVKLSQYQYHCFDINIIQILRFLILQW